MSGDPNISPALAALFNNVVENNGTFFVARLYTISLFGGDVIRLTDSDCDVVGGSSPSYDLYNAGNLYQSTISDLYAYGGAPVAGFTYTASGVKVDQAASKTQVHLKIGLDTDLWTVVFMPRPFDPITGAAFPDTIGSVPWLQACIGGALDSADFQVDEAYFASPPTWPITPGGAVPVGCRTVFAGTVAEVDVTNSQAIVTANDYRALMTLSMPRHFFQGSCRFTLFDNGCNASGNMNAATFGVSSTAAAGSTQSSVNSSTNITLGGSQTAALGRIQFTSGANATFWRTIKSWNGDDNFVLFNPLPFPVAVGDAFTVYPGCDKLYTTCNMFQPTAVNNFGGQLFIPPPEIVGGG